MSVDEGRGNGEGAEGTGKLGSGGKLDGAGFARPCAVAVAVAAVAVGAAAVDGTAAVDGAAAVDVAGRVDVAAAAPGSAAERTSGATIVPVAFGEATAALGELDVVDEGVADDIADDVNVDDDDDGAAVAVDAVESSCAKNASMPRTDAAKTPLAIHVIVLRSRRGEDNVDDSEVAIRSECTVVRGVRGTRAPPLALAGGFGNEGPCSDAGSGVESSAIGSPVAAHTNASPAAFAEAKRSSGARAQARANHSSSASGSSGTRSVRRGIVVWIASVMAPTVAPSKGRAPVSASNASTPSDQMSVRASTSSPRICSGLM